MTGIHFTEMCLVMLNEALSRFDKIDKQKKRSRPLIDRKIAMIEGSLMIIWHFLKKKLCSLVFSLVFSWYFPKKLLPWLIFLFYLQFHIVASDFCSFVPFYYTSSSAFGQNQKTRKSNRVRLRNILTIEMINSKNWKKVLNNCNHTC